MDTINRRTTSAHAAHVPARLQATWAELVRRLGVSNFEKNYIFGILMKNCTKYQSAIKIRDVAGTPNVHRLVIELKHPIFGFEHRTLNIVQPITTKMVNK